MKQRWSNRVADTLRIFMRRGALFVVAGVCALTLTLSPLTTRTAHAQFDIGSLTGIVGGGLSSCAIETVGWVICPTMRSIARLADYGFTYINQSFLKIDYNIASNSSGTYKAWELMRTIANALFVVAFMALIYSQLTGRNSGGYNIKRLLPRLIIAAVAVNISYYICVIFVDASNVLGDSVLNVLVGIAQKVGNPVMPVQQTASGFSYGTLTTITGSIVSKPGTAWVLLAPCAAVIISIATVSAAMLIFLIMRKTLVAMLILVSPVLFVGYLLPNLERFFFQGARLFIQMLLLYPIIALLLGAGQIVSATIVSVGSNDTNYSVSGDNYTGASGGSGSAVTDLTAAAAAVMPLLAVYFVFKNMSSLMSTAGARLSASVGSRRGGQGDKEARVTGKATAGAASMKNPAGMGGSRRPAFSRNRHRTSLAGSALTAEEIRQSRAQNKKQDEENARDAAARGQEAGGMPGLDQNINQGDQNIDQGDKNTQQGDQNVQLNQENKSVGEAAAQALLGAKGHEKDKDDKKGVTAKDIFNNMNQGHQHSSKDSQRTFGAGPAVTGGGGQVVGGGGAAPVAPSISYSAPQIAQSANVVSGSAAGAPVQVVAVPVSVDMTGFTGGASSASIPDAGLPPITGTQEKAKARASQYLFNAEKELDEDRDKQDILGHKDHEPLAEQPHIPVGHATGKEEDK